MEVEKGIKMNNYFKSSMYCALVCYREEVVSGNGWISCGWIGEDGG
jgi:hypothetical protein